MKNWTFTELDQRLAAELQARLPSALFNAHAHVWRTADMAQPVAGLWAEGPAEAGGDLWRRHVGRQVGAPQARITTP